MENSIDELVKVYGEGSNCPSRDQWKNLLEGDLSQPLTVVNFFKLRKNADTAIIDDAISGEEAFSKYAEVSVPTVDKVGGHFALRGVVENDFMGDKLLDWDLIAVGQYPERKNFIELLMDKEYQACVKYRQAAVEAQHVYFVNAM